MQLVEDFKAWIDREPARKPDDVGTDGLSPEYFMTGPDIVDRLVKAIELNQSVILAGPRGCGKSFCVQQAIDEATRRGLLVRGAYKFIQGNREIPRDYLVEDEIAFRTVTVGGVEKVVPYRRSAPLFAFADRDKKDGNPICKPGTKDVHCVIEDPSNPGNTIDLPKFVLFLDEINRFSDGVLDSLLSVLEERKAVLAGTEYKLPVVVLMTMNPPGYDATARKLSPPLAARIGRSYRLFTPDLDTLGDVIVRSKLLALKRQYDSSRTATDPKFPDIPIELQRKAGLTTLCLWGDIRTKLGEPPKPGNDYLTGPTRASLLSILNDLPNIRRPMLIMSRLCQFGPDGRAAADWLTTAIGLALDEAKKAGITTDFPLRADHLTRTVVQSVAHKIYDTFSEGARPDLTARKEQAVRMICEQVFDLRSDSPLISRTIDNQALIDRELAGPFNSAHTVLSALFVDAQVTSDEMVKPWIAVAQAFRAGRTDVLKLLIESELVEQASGSLLAGFTDRRHEDLARALQAKTKGALSQALKVLLAADPRVIGPVRQKPWDEVAIKVVMVALGVKRVRTSLVEDIQWNTNERSHILAVVSCLDLIWSFVPQSDDANAECNRLRDSMATLLPTDKGNPSTENRVMCVQRWLPEIRDRAASNKGDRAGVYIEALELLARRLDKDKDVARRNNL